MMEEAKDMERYFRKMKKWILLGYCLLFCSLAAAGCGGKGEEAAAEQPPQTQLAADEEPETEEERNASGVDYLETEPLTEATPSDAEKITAEIPPQEIGLDPEWEYAEFSKITEGKAILYQSSSQSPRDKVICVNAGHGTEGGSSVKTQCHPDGTPKVTGGTTGAGAYTAAAVSGGMTFADGTPEAEVTLQMARILKDKLLENGYDVLMIRTEADVQLDNVARTVIANQCADCHIALHWDSTETDKGAFYMSVPEVKSYREMEPVASNWEESERLGDCLIAGLKERDIKIFSGGSMDMDLTQTSYSTVPSVDVELGDKVSDHSDEYLEQLAEGLVLGVERFFGDGT